MGSCIEWDLAVGVLGAYDEDGFLGVQPDAFGEAKSGVVPHETHFPDGLYSRIDDAPIDANGNPDPAKAHQILVGMEGGKGHVWPLENPAVVTKLPVLKRGEKVFYGPLAQFLRGRDDGSFSAWCPANADGDPDFSFDFGPDGVSISGRWGKFEMNDSRFTFQHVSGARIDLGAAGGAPAPLSAIKNHVVIQTDSFDAQAPAVSLGPDAGTIPSPIPNGTFLLAELLAIKLALTAIQAAFASALPISGITAAQTAAVQAACGFVLPPSPTLLYANANATVG